MTSDKSNGWEDIAGLFMRVRNPRVGAEVAREWSRTLPAGGFILDLGCGHGVPITQTLIEQGFAVYGIDASPKLIAAFRQRFPDSPAECSAVEDSALFGRTFDGVIAWGLLFLLTPEIQAAVIARAAAALGTGGSFLFTAPAEAVTWTDSLTERPSISLGRDRYAEILQSAGMKLSSETSDEGGNHYYCAIRI